MISLLIWVFILFIKLVAVTFVLQLAMVVLGTFASLFDIKTK